MTERSIGRQSIEELAGLLARRTRLVSAPDVQLPAIARYDERLAAHLDVAAGLGEELWPFRELAPDEPLAGAAFAAAVQWIGRDRSDELSQILSLAGTDRDVRRALLLALEWIEPVRLRGVLARATKSSDARTRSIAISASRRTALDIGNTLAESLVDASALVRASGLRTVGEVGRQDLLDFCIAATQDADASCRYWAAWSCVLLGERIRGLQALSPGVDNAGRPCNRGCSLALQAMSAGASADCLSALAGNPSGLRPLIQAIGIVGDSAQIEWLIEHMGYHKTARLAGESFTLITGADLDPLQLWRQQPDDVETGPSDDPDDPDVDVDADQGLLWPDQEKVRQWWVANSRRFLEGQRYFMGAPVTWEHCINVLKSGYQRQRILAAHYLCLLRPGTPLFNISAPARRQRRLLSQMH